MALVTQILIRSPCNKRRAQIEKERHNSSLEVGKLLRKIRLYEADILFIALNAISARRNHLCGRRSFPHELDADPIFPRKI